MRMIYLDESARDDRYYFFGALIADADAIRAIENGFNEVAELVAHNVPGFSSRTEFHAVDMFQGHAAWKSVPVPWRVKACNLAAKVLARSAATYIFRGIDLTALRAKYARPYPPHLITLAQVLQESDACVSKLDRPDKLAIAHADDHHAANSARRSFRNFRYSAVPGYTTRRLATIADTIYFGPSHESRLLQAADIATYFINRDRTIIETDQRTARAVKRIVTNIRSITTDEYVWSPQ